MPNAHILCPFCCCIVLAFFALTAFKYYQHSYCRTSQKLKTEEQTFTNSSSSSLFGGQQRKNIIPSKSSLIIQHYVEQHSQEQLSAEFSACENQQWSLKDCEALQRRKFAVGYYSCPNQAGNRLHHFMNALFFAIITNRTLLWKYYDSSTCQEVGREYSPWICKAANTQEECDKTMSLMPWIPSLKQWTSRLRMSSTKPHDANWWQLHLPPKEEEPDGRKKHDREKHPYTQTDRTVNKIDLEEEQLIHFGHLYGVPGDQLDSQSTIDTMFATNTARYRASQLLRNGKMFLGGMLFRLAFKLGDHIEQSATALPYDKENTFTIALHSRHTSVDGDVGLGSDVDDEKKCLMELKQASLSTEKDCIVFLMSDRPATLVSLHEWINSEMNCTAVIPEHHDIGMSWKKEHGPYAGSGFFQDLALVSQARDAVVLSPRSSSHLLEELIVYDRTAEGRDTKLAKCVLPKK